MAKNEARNNLMAALTANRKARKDAKAKLTETINAAYAEYRKLVADLKAERKAAIDKYLAAKKDAKKPDTKKPTRKAAKKTAKKTSKKAAKKTTKKAAKKAAETVAEKVA